MSLRLATTTLLLFAVALPVIPVAAQSPAQSFLYGEKRFRHACQPPLKFAAGACVRHCPAGYRNTGGYCRFLGERMR
ncbi:hypothetical protein [Methylobacterium sp. NEAU K]|uniref:hypothetical protein n=1 Tax=Methylobacterium sp. NEAU K TaxID=3064946 RepID=UPI002736D9A1|nr:hypothetical protein [Methylobacterium sp. NEAU K]MDP4004862.1 hypothetical protein [Methylobacterium sp. NEAU K]